MAGFRRHTARPYRLLLLTLLLRPFGNLTLAWGVHHVPRFTGMEPLPFLQALVNPFVAMGIANADSSSAVMVIAGGQRLFIFLRAATTYRLWTTFRAVSGMTSLAFRS